MFVSNSNSDVPTLNAGATTANANLVQFFPSQSSSQQQSVTPTPTAVIVRSSEPGVDGTISTTSSDGYANYPLCSTAPSYQHYQPVQFPFLFGAHEWNFFQHPSSTDSSCSPAQITSQIASPIIQHTALANSLTPIQQPPSRFQRNLQYDCPSNTGGTNQMTGLPRSGARTGRKPRDHETGSYQDDDPDEMEKKLKRRQRNKEAAARCRQRRLDLMGNLQETVDKLSDQNRKKEDEIRIYRQKVSDIATLFKTYELPAEIKIKLSSILDHNFLISNCSMRTEDRNIPMANDYQPRGMEHVIQRRPISHGPPESDITLLEPDEKPTKLDSDPILAGINQMDENIPKRPYQLGMHTVPTSSNAGTLSTPSNLSHPATFTNLSFNAFPGGENYFLNQPTGLTPSAAPNVGFVPQTPTSLPTSASELHPL